MRSFTWNLLICSLAAFLLGVNAAETRTWVLGDDQTVDDAAIAEALAQQRSDVEALERSSTSDTVQTTGTATDETVVQLNETCLSCLGAVFHFAVNISEFRLSDCVNSTPITLSHVPWKVTLCKRGQAVDAILSPDHSETTDRPDAWSCDAAAIFNLHPKDADKNSTISKNLTQQTFSSSSEPQSVEIISNFTQFLADYVRDNEATFEVEILTGPLSSKVPTNMIQTQQTFHIVLEKVRSTNEFFSPEVMLRDIKWRIHVQRLQNSILGVSLQALNTDPNWSYNVTCNIDILSFNKNVSPLVLNLTHTFNGKSSEVEIGHTTWSQFIDEASQFVVRDKAIMQVRMSVDQPKPLWEPKRNICAGKEHVIASGATNQGPSHGHNDGMVTELPCSVCLNKFSSGQIFSTRCGHLYCNTCFNSRVYPIDVCAKCGASATSRQAVYF